MNRFERRQRIPCAQLIAVRRIGLPTVHVETDFRAVCRMADEGVFGLALAGLGQRSFTLALDATGTDGVLRLASRHVRVSTDLDSHRAVPLPPNRRTALARFQGAA